MSAVPLTDDRVALVLVGMTYGQVGACLAPKNTCGVQSLPRFLSVNVSLGGLNFTQRTKHA